MRVGKLKSKKCEMCGEVFFYERKLARFCQNCQAVIKKEQTKAWYRAHYVPHPRPPRPKKPRPRRPIGTTPDDYSPKFDSSRIFNCAICGKEHHFSNRAWCSEKCKVEFERRVKQEKEEMEIAKWRR